MAVKVNGCMVPWRGHVVCSIGACYGSSTAVGKHVAVRDTMRPLLVGLGTAAAAAAAIAIYQRRRRSPPSLDAEFIATTIDDSLRRRPSISTSSLIRRRGARQARAAGKRSFVTNAASASRESLAKKLAKMGISGVTAADCITSASAAAQYLATNHPDVKRAYVVGGGGLIEELKLCGIESVGEADTGGIEQLLSSGGLEASLPIDAIVCGMQVEGLCYARLAKAAAYARDRKRPIVGTKPENAGPPAGPNFCPLAAATSSTSSTLRSGRRMPSWASLQRTSRCSSKSCTSSTRSGR